MRYRLFRLVASLARFVCLAALRAVITVAVFAICLMLAASYMGVPLPSPSELLERFESVSQLAKILS
jgi:hypothetical protein